MGYDRFHTMPQTLHATPRRYDLVQSLTIFPQQPEDRYSRRTPVAGNTI